MPTISNPPRLLIRADGNGQIGLGHVVRSLALAEIVDQQFAQVLLLSQDPPPAVQRLAAGHGRPLRTLPAQPIRQELYTLPDLLRPGDIVVLDGYHFPLVYQQAIKALNCRLVVIDDLRQPTVADLVINHGPGVTPADYEAPPSTRFCLGPAFSLLRRPFREQAALPAAAPRPITSALLCFGGADPLGLTARSLTALLALPQVVKVGLVLGAAFSGGAALRQLAELHPGRTVNFYEQLSASEFATVFGQYDVAVVPSSTVLLEALVLGRPAITGYYADNQAALADYVHAYGQAFSVGNFADLAGEKLAGALAQGLHFHETTRRQPYVDHLRPDLLQAEFARLIA